MNILRMLNVVLVSMNFFMINGSADRIGSLRRVTFAQGKALEQHESPQQAVARKEAAQKVEQLRIDQDRVAKTVREAEQRRAQSRTLPIDRQAAEKSKSTATTDVSKFEEKSQMQDYEIRSKGYMHLLFHGESGSVWRKLNLVEPSEEEQNKLDTKLENLLVTSEINISNGTRKPHEKLDVEKIKKLLNQGAKPNNIDPNVIKSLIVKYSKGEVAQNFPEVLTMLVKAGLDHQKSQYVFENTSYKIEMKTLLQFAIAHKQKEIAQALVNAGVPATDVQTNKINTLDNDVSSQRFW